MVVGAAVLLLAAVLFLAGGFKHGMSSCMLLAVLWGAHMVPLCLSQCLSVTVCQRPFPAHVAASLACANNNMTLKTSEVQMGDWWAKCS